MKQVAIGLLMTFACLRAWSAGYPLYIEAVKEDDGVWAVVAHNAGSAPVFLSITLKNRVNVRIGGLSSSGQKALEPGAKETVVLAIPERPDEKMSFEYESKWIFGRGTNKGDHIGVYRPPFPADMTFDTLNSAGDAQRNPKTLHSIDIMMPEGTPVVAARSGYVMDVAGQVGGDKVQGSFPDYDDPSKMGNYVRIFHDDGTWAEYLHLKADSVTVKPGTRIEAGTQLGLSGMTGAATRPHLEFTVLKPTGSFGVPASQQIKMEMAGRGVKVIKIGDVIGASNSVLSEEAIVLHDPLVLAAVRKNEHVGQTGIYKASGGSSARTEQAAFIGIGIGIAGIGLATIWLIRERKKANGWKAVFAKLRRTKGKQAAQEVDTDPNAKGSESQDLGKEVNLRPARGYMIADWEAPFLNAVSLGMPVGYTCHLKVSLNRLMPRPLWTRQDEAGLAILRGESIDVVIVRLRDNKIVVAMDIKRDYQRLTGQEFAARAKQEMLEDAGIKYIELDADTGPSKISDALKSSAPNDMDGFGLRDLARKVA